ncbi:PAS domain S-box protein, partial [bacterium]|nr:PAS domain S-box protein [bacterium]
MKITTLKELDKTLSSAIEQSIDGIAVADAGLKLTYVNSAFAKMHGSAPREMVGMKVLKLHSKEQMATYKKVITQIKREGSWRGEISHTRKDGTVFPAYMVVTLFKKGTRITGYLAICRDITERKRTEELLRKSEDIYHTVVEVMPTLIYRFLPDGTLTFVNKAYCDYFGKERKELVGKSFLQFIPKADRARVKKKYTSLNRQRPRMVYEHQIVTPDGKIRWQRRSDQVLTFAEDGSPAEYQSIGDDITERKEAELRYRELIEKEKDIIYTLDARGNITLASPAIEIILGYQPKEVIGKHFKSLVPKEWQKKTMADFNKLLEKGEIVSETILLDKKGHPHYVEYTSTVIKEGNRIVGTRGIVRDLTERKKIEEEHRKLQERLAGIFHSSMDAISYSNLDGVLVDVNEAFCKLVGYSKEELINKKKYQDITPEEYHEIETKIIDEVLRTEEPRAYEKEYVKKDGTRFPVFLSVFAVKGDDGRPKALAATIKDITERKKIRKELTRHRDHLKELVKERAGELVRVNERLQQEITERKKTEKALRESEERFRAIFESARDSIFIKDRALRYTLVNPAMEKLFGLPASQILGKKDDDLFDKVAASHIREVDSRVLKGKVIEEEHTKEIKDNTFTFHVIKVPMHDATGEVIGLCGIARDITERKQAEDILRDSEDQLNTILSSMQDLVFRIDKEGRFIFNHAPRGEKLYMPPEEFLGKRVEEVMPPHFKKPFAKAFAKNKRNQIALWEYWLELAGEKLWYSVNMAPIFAKNKFIGSVAVSRNITERREAEAALRESEERFQQVTENSLVWIWEVDATGLYTYASPIVEKILGYRPKEIVGKKHFYDFFTPATREEMKKKAFKAFTRKQPFRELINLNVHKSGKVVWLLTSGTPICDKKGHLLGYRGADTDITERREAEEALRESEEKWRSLIQNLPDIVMTVARDGTIKALNRTVIEESVEETLGRSIYDYIPSEHSETVRKAMKHVFQTGRFTSYTIRGAGLKGPDMAWYETRLIPVKRDGEVIAATLISTDITKRKEVEETIRRAKREWEETVDAVRDMVFLTDIEGKVLRCNRALIERFQTTFSDLVGKKVSEIFYGDSRPDPRFISPSFTRSFHLEIHEIRFPT